MAPKKILTDSGFLRALYDKEHKLYPPARAVAQTSGTLLVAPYVVLTETAFLFRRDGGVPAVMRFLDTLTAARPQLEAVHFDNLARAREIMATYRTAHLDFVDCCLVAVAERLDITQICTFDRRDFGIIRTQRGNFLEILP